MKKLLWNLALIAILSPITAALAQRNMTIVDLLNLPSVTDPQLSPDGSQILFVRGDSDWEKNRRIQHIWRMNTDGTGAVQLTNGATSETSPRWSPEGTTIAFTSKRDGDEQTQVYLLNNSGGEARRLFEHKPGVSNIAWSPDGTSILFVAPDPEPKADRKRKQAKDDVFAFEEEFRQKHLWQFQITGSKPIRITEGDFSVLDYKLSLDGSSIVTARGPTPLPGDRHKRELWVRKADGSAERRITNNSSGERGAELSPDNRQVLYLATTNEKDEPYYESNLFILSSEGDQARLQLPDFGHEISAAHWSADGKSIYFLANLGVHNELFKLDVASGKYRQLTEGKHALSNWNFSPRLGSHLFHIRNRESGNELWFLGGEENAKLTRVTHVHDFLAQDFNLPRQEAVTWKGADGVRVEGLLTYPIGYEQGKRYPLVVQTHGGPRSSTKYGLITSWSVYLPVLAARGYAVLQPNYRGSTGYGDAFLRDMVGSYFRNAHLDVLAGVDHLIEQGIVDGDKMVKMGWSAGGHMTNKIITFTNRFKAAASGAGAVNWVSMYGQSDVRTNRTPWFGGSPWQENAPLDVYWANSPLKDIWKVKTPTLILVGELDARVPMPQSVELYRALRSNGVPTKLYVAPREPHGWRELRHRLHKINAELDWFETYAMGREYEWEMAPQVKVKVEEEEDLNGEQ